MFAGLVQTSEWPRFEISELVQSLLGACGLYGEVELGKRSPGKVVKLEPWKYGPHVWLSNSSF